MVRRLLGFFYRETGTLNRAALYLGFFAFLSQVLAFLRDRLLAHIFGASQELDIYYAAFRIPDLIFVTAASIVSLSVLIPFIIEKDALGRERLRKFIDDIFSFFGVLILSVSVLAYFLLPALAGILFKGLAPEALAEVIFISRMLLLSPIILGFSNLFGSLTQAYNRFAIYALAPLLYNAGIIFGIILFSDEMGVRGVALGVIIGALLHALIQVPFVIRSGLLPRLSLSFDFREIVRVMKISLPRTLTLSMSALSILYLTALASLMSEGSISILSFSINLQSIPLSLIGVSYSLAAFPTLTRSFKRDEPAAFIKQMSETARFIIFWSVPITALLIVLRAQIVRVLLGSGVFDWDATRLVAAALALFVLSSMFQSLILLFMRGFYSAGSTSKPFYINLVSTFILAGLTYGLVKLFYAREAFSLFVSALLKVEDLPAVILMLPLGFSIGTIINGVLLWAAFEREFRGFSKGVLRTLFEGLGASFIMGGTSYAALSILARYLETDTLLGIFFQGLLSGLIGITAAVLVLITLKSRELSVVWDSLRGKFWKTKIIATDPEIV